MLYNKLNAGYSSSQIYDNSIGGSGGAGGASHGNIYGSGAGGFKPNYNNKAQYNMRQYETTTPSPSAANAAAQILSK